jgi:type II secretory pathway pseudopilin PulG
MIVVAIIGLVTASAIKLGAVLQRARAEQELLRIGAEFSDALQSYADATPAGKPSQPASLKDLLKDPRFPTTRRHLRKLYVDPMTGKAEWGIVYLGEKAGVVAVYSLSEDKPVKIGNFPTRFSGFEGKSHISDWKFTMTGKTATNSQDSPMTPTPVVVSQPTGPTPVATSPISPNSTPAAAPEAPVVPNPAPEKAPAEPAPEGEPSPPPAPAEQ